MDRQKNICFGAVKIKSKKKKSTILSIVFLNSIKLIISFKPKEIKRRERLDIIASARSKSLVCLLIRRISLITLQWLHIIYWFCLQLRIQGISALWKTWAVALDILNDTWRTNYHQLDTHFLMKRWKKVDREFIDLSTNVVPILITFY